MLAQSQNLQNLKDRKKQYFDLLMVLLTVVLFYLAFPSGGFGDLSWFALAPVIIALNKSSASNAFTLGLLAATLGWMCSIWWAVIGIAEITSTAANLVVPIVFIFCLLSALPYALGAWLYVRYNLGNSAVGALASAVLFTVLVNYIPHILPGNLAHALYQRPLLIQFADVGGVPLVFFIIHLVNFLLANTVTLVKKNQRKSISCLILAIIVFMVTAGYGQYRMQQSSTLGDNASKKINIAIIQPNIAISNRSRNDWQVQQDKLIVVLEQINKNKDIDLIVFPEVPVPVSYQYYREDKAYFDRHVPSKPFLLTAIKPADDGLEYDVVQGGSSNEVSLETSNGYFNTIELITGKNVSQEYTKQVLLPFGEYIPFEKSIPWLRDLFTYAPNYKPGSQGLLLSLKIKDDLINIIPLICYEAVFTDIVGKGVLKGGELLINSSNDDWFGDIAGKNTHYALSIFRTVEYRKFLVRATNTGASGVITPYGYLLDGSQIDDNALGYSVNELHIKPLESFYSQYPSLIKYLFLFLALVIILFGRKLDVKH